MSDEQSCSGCKGTTIHHTCGKEPSAVMPESFGALTQGAFGMHEMFLSWMEAGFTERQALILLAELIAAGGRRDDS